MDKVKWLLIAAALIVIVVIDVIWVRYVVTSDWPVWLKLWLL